MTHPTQEDDVKPIRDALAAKPTQGPYRVVVDEHPFKTATGGGFHIERRIFTTWDHPQMKGPMGIVNRAVGLGVEQRRHFVAMDEADANFLAECYPERIARLLDRLEQAERDAGRWQEVIRHVGADRQCGGFRFTLYTLPPVRGTNPMQGAVCQHFTAAIDAHIAAIACEAKT